jgi:hypothetical protein
LEVSSKLIANLKYFDSFKYQTHAYFVVSILISLVLFFKNNSLPIFFEKDIIAWYFEYSQNIFHPTDYHRGIYFGESILLPILANLIGASKSFIAFKIFCVIIEISIIPVFAYSTLYYFKSISRASILVLLLSLTFMYFKKYEIGFPDPLTILLLIMLPLFSAPFALIVLTSLAMLSHFSMAFIAVGCLIPLIYFQQPKHAFDKYKVLYLIVGIVMGRLLLQIWYYKFDYLHVLGRLNWVTNKGFQFFLERYESGVSQFWLNPGILFLATYSLCIIFLWVNRKYLLSLASLFSLMIAYLVLFLTVDWIRCFSEFLSPSYVFLLSYSINLISNALNQYRQTAQ